MPPDRQQGGPPDPTPEDRPNENPAARQDALAAESTPTPAATWGERFADSIEADHCAGRIDAHVYANSRAHADFCVRHGAAIPAAGVEIDLYGFGAVPAAFVPAEGRDVWMWLADLVEPTAVDLTALILEFRREHAEGSDDVDEIPYVYPDGGPPTPIPVVTRAFAMRILIGPSPWAPEFAENLTGVFRRAAARSGVVAVSDAPSEQDARRLAFRGPALGQPGESP